MLDALRVLEKRTYVRRDLFWLRCWRLRGVPSGLRDGIRPRSSYKPDHAWISDVVYYIHCLAFFCRNISCAVKPEVRIVRASSKNDSPAAARSRLSTPVSAHLSQSTETVSDTFHPSNPYKNIAPHPTSRVESQSLENTSQVPSEHFGRLELYKLLSDKHNGTSHISGSKRWAQDQVIANLVTRRKLQNSARGTRSLQRSRQQRGASLRVR
jgi:hypothetical protein